VNPLVALMVSQPGMAERLLAVHTDDGTGRCRVCSDGAQAGHHAWPCSIHGYATRAVIEVAAVPRPAALPLARRRRGGARRVELFGRVGELRAVVASAPTGDIGERRPPLMLDVRVRYDVKQRRLIRLQRREQIRQLVSLETL
jgi:hypothetical protein